MMGIDDNNNSTLSSSSSPPSINSSPWYGAYQTSSLGSSVNPFKLDATDSSISDDIPASAELPTATFLRLVSQSSDPRFDPQSLDGGQLQGQLKRAIRAFVDTTDDTERGDRAKDVREEHRFLASRARHWKDEVSSAGESSVRQEIIDNQRQDIIIFLLQKVCALVDQTPKTFVLNCLRMYEFGILTDISFLEKGPLIRNNETPVSGESSARHRGKKSAALVPSNIDIPILHLDASSGLPSTGLTVSRYASDFEEVGRLGEGAFGSVFKVKHKLDGRSYAVKQIKFSNVGFEPLIQRKVLREVRCLAQLDHRNVCRYHNAWIESVWDGAGEEDLTQNRRQSLSRAHINILNSSATDATYSATDATYSATDVTRSATDATSSATDAIVKIRDRAKFNAISSRDEVGDSVDLDLSFDQSQRFSVSSAFEFEEFEDKKSDLDEDSCVQFDEKLKISVEQSQFLADADSADPDDLGRVGTADSVLSKLRNATIEATEKKQKSLLSQALLGRHDILKNRRTRRGSSICNTVMCPRRNSMSIREVDFDSDDERQNDEYENEEKQLAIQSCEHCQQVEDIAAVATNLKYFVKLFIQTELCDESNLRGFFFERGNVQESRCMRIFYQILSGLEHIHTNGIIHRDLKPENIFISSRPKKCSCCIGIKIGDFGLSRLVSEYPGDMPVTPRSLTLSGARFPTAHTRGVGTSTYCSPEQLGGRSYCTKADVFSCGVILFEMLNNFETAMERAMKLGDLRSGIIPEEFSKNFPEESRLILQMTTPNPTKRPSATKLLADDFVQSFSQCRERFLSRPVLTHSVTPPSILSHARSYDSVSLERAHSVPDFQRNAPIKLSEGAMADHIRKQSNMLDEQARLIEKLRGELEGYKKEKNPID
eukprot:777496_1